MKPSFHRHPISIFLLSLAVGSSAVIAATASADEFSVQIGAFREAPSGFAAAATEIGELKTSQTKDGLTRFQIGSFDSKQAAQTAKNALVGAGYADAFVVEKGVGRRVARRATEDAAERTATPASARSKTTPSSSRDPLAGVPESLRSRVVILDGAYFVKDGNQFTPLSEALAADN